MKRIQELFAKSWFYPVFLLLLMALAYDLQINQLGFYWDDWQAIFLSHQNSPAAYWDYFLYDRPFSAWTYSVTMPVLGLYPLRWQVFTLLMRWLGILAFCWALRGIWPEHRREVRWIGVLLAVFPGFLQQPVSVAYSQHFITAALFAFSLALMVWAVREPRRFWIYTPLALLFSTVHMFVMEYFVGLELLRPALLWILLRRRGEEPPAVTAKKVLRYGWPYLLPLAGFIAFRFYVYPTLLPEIDPNSPVLLQQMLSDPFGALRQFVELGLSDFFYENIFVWLASLQPNAINLEKKINLFSWLVGLAAAVLVGWVDLRGTAAQDRPEQPSRYFVREGVLLGILAVFLGGLPVWITNRQASVGTWSDRFSLGMMWGVAVLLVSLVFWMVHSSRSRTLLLSILVGLSVSTHIQAINGYRRYWDIQREYYWQLSWRAPSLEPGTVIVGPGLPFSYVADYSLGFALNTLYADEITPGRISYWWVSAPRTWSMDKVGDLDPGDGIEYDLRNVKYKGTVADAVAVSYNPSRGCLRVLDTVYRDVREMEDGEQDLWRLANPGRILPQEEIDRSALRQLFGPQPEKDWCYYFEQADLARQYAEWDSAVELAERAAALDLTPKQGAEWIPFIEAYAHTGDWERAVGLTLEANRLTEKMETPLCRLWKQIERETDASPSREAALAEARSALGCAQPVP